MIHLMRRNRFALGKFTAVMLVVVFLVSIPAAYLGTAASDQKQAAIREAMDEVLTRIKEKGAITLEDYEELKNVLDSAGGAGKYELDINIVRPHEHQQLDDITACLPDDGVRTDIPFAPGTGTHVHDETCLAHNPDGTIKDYSLRCGPTASGVYVIESTGRRCYPCTDGHYIIKEIDIQLPADIININNTSITDGNTYEVGSDKKHYIMFNTPFTVTYADGSKQTFDGFQGDSLDRGFGLTARFNGMPEVTRQDGVAYQYTLPSDAVYYFYGCGSAFYKYGTNPDGSNDEFNRGSCAGTVICTAKKCEHCGIFYNPDECTTYLGKDDDGYDLYEVQCPYCAVAFDSYSANYSETVPLYLNHDATGLGDFQMKGVHPDGKEEIITTWTFDREIFNNIHGEGYITVTYSDDGVVNACDVTGSPKQYAYHNRGQINSIHIYKNLCHCDNTTNHPDGKVLYYLCNDDGTGTECPYCSRMPQKLNLGYTGVIQAPYPTWTALEEVLTNVHLDTMLGKVELPYISGTSSGTKGWTYTKATEAELEENRLTETGSRKWYHIKAWDYFTYNAYDPETKTITEESADDNEFDAYIAVTNELKLCETCGMLHELNTDGSDPGCPYCAKKIRGIKVYSKGTDIEAKTVRIKDYYWGSSNDIATTFDVIAEYFDGHTENISETHPEWLCFAKEVSGTTIEGTPYSSFQKAEIQPGKQTVTIALIGTDDTGKMLADTSVSLYAYTPSAENPTGIISKTVSVINHSASGVVTVIQRMYRCENKFPEGDASEMLPEGMKGEEYHYILADEEGVCPDECQTCKYFITDVECTLNPMTYRVSEYGWDDVANTFLYGHNYFRAKTLDGKYHDLVPMLKDVSSFGDLSSVGVDPNAIYYYPDVRLIDYTPAPGKHKATITLRNPHLLTKREDEPYTDHFVGRSPLFYDAYGKEYSMSIIPYMQRVFEIEIFQDVCKCDKCGQYYHTDEDGNDPGCPYCTHVLESIRPDPDIYMVASLDREFDLPSIFKITAVYEDGTEADTYTDDTGVHTISSACTFTPHADNQYKYTVKYVEKITYTPCDEDGSELEPKIIERSAECEVEIRLNIAKCDVCGHYYLGGPNTECPYCAVKIESIETDVTTINCTVHDLDHLEGFFKVYGVHPKKVIEPCDEYPEGAVLGGEKEEIPFSKLVTSYTPGKLSISYTYSATAECLNADGTPNKITITNETRATQILVNLSGKVECSRCHYIYDLGSNAAAYGSDFDVQAHCPYCDHIFYDAYGNALNTFRTVQFNSYMVGSDEETITPGTAKTSGTRGTQAQSGTYAVIEKGMTVNQILSATAVEMLSAPGHQIGIQTGTVPWNTGAVSITVSADAPTNAYNSEVTGYQTFTARYTAEFEVYTATDSTAMPKKVTQTCDVVLLLDVYDACDFCSRMFSSRAGHGRCPYCSLDSIEVTPGELADELGMLRNIRPYISVVAKFHDGHTEAITSDDNTAKHDYTDNFQPDLKGDQNVTISLTDVFDTTKTATVKVNLEGYWVCPICLHKYTLNDGSTPHCEQCENTYVQLSAEPASIRKEWNALYDSADIKSWLTVQARTKDSKWHELSASDYDTDFVPNGIGQRAVTVSAKDIYGNTVSTTVTVDLYKKYSCPVCGHEYSANPDGSDPGCPLCPTIVTGYEAGMNKTSYNLDETPSLYFRVVYKDGHKEDKLSMTTNNFDSRTAGTRDLTFSYLGNSIPGGTYTVINNYLIHCPTCGTEVDTRTVGYDVNEKGYCPTCEHEIVMLSVRPSATWLVPGTTNRVYYGSSPDVIVELVARNGVRTQVYDYELTGFDTYNTSTTQTLTATAFGHIGHTEVLVIKRGTAEDPIGEIGHTAAITIDGIGYALCPICSHYFRVDLAACPYCDFAKKYGEFIDDPDSHEGFRLLAGSAEYEAFSNVIYGDSELIVLDEILDRLYALPGIIEQVKAASDVNLKADLLGLTGEDRDSYIKAYADLAALEALKTADPTYVYSDGELGQMAYLKGIIDTYETPGYVLDENDIVIITIKKIRPNVFDYINDLFSDNYEATYFTSSAVISKRY